MYSTVYDVPFGAADDTVHISIANSFREKGVFDIDFRGSYIHDNSRNVEDLIQKYPDISFPQAQKGPVYYILLSGFYSLLDTESSDFYFHGSIFNAIFSILFVIVFYFLIRKLFGFKVAVISTLLVSFLPFYSWYSVRILPSAFLIFFLLSLFFLSRKKSHYFLFAIFAGLANLTHPIGFTFAASYFVYLLLSKNLKGFLISIISFHLIILPWVIRNYLIWGDVGWGLGFPFSTTISSVLRELFPVSKTITETNLSSRIVTQLDVASLPHQNIIFLWDHLSRLFQLEFLLYFVLIFTSFAFIKLSKINIRSPKLFIFLFLFSLFYFVVWQVTNYEFSLIATFFIPVMLFAILYFKHRDIFLEKIPNFAKFALVYFFISLIQFHAISIFLNKINPEPRFILFSLILIIPIAVYGFSNFSNNLFNINFLKIKKNYFILGITIVLLVSFYFAVWDITDYKLNLLPKFLSLALTLIIPIFLVAVYSFSNSSNRLFDKISIVKNKQTILIILILIILVPIFYQFSNGIGILYNYPGFQSEGEEISEVNSFLRNHVPTNTVIASNEPGLTFLRTGIQSVALPDKVQLDRDFSQMNFEKFIAHYQINYLVLYSHDFSNFDTSVASKINSWIPDDYFYDLEFNFEGSSVFSVINIMNSDISHPYAYMSKGVKLDQSGNHDEANIVFSELNNLPYLDPRMSETLCKYFTNNEKTDYAQNQCELLLLRNPGNAVSYLHLPLIYSYQNDKEKSLDVLNEFEDILIEKELFKTYGTDLDLTYEKLLLTDKSINDDLDRRFKLGQEFYMNGNYDESLNYLNILRLLHNSVPDIASESILITSQIQFEIDEDRDKTKSLTILDDSVDTLLLKLEEFEHSGSTSDYNQAKTKIISQLMQKIIFLDKLNEGNQIERVLNKILALDRTYYDAWVLKGELLESRENYSGAIAAYNEALRDESKYDEIQTKIANLQEKLSKT